MLLRSVDHPEANGRRPEKGEQQWVLTIPLEGRKSLILKLGKKTRDTIFGMMVAEETEDEIEARKRKQED
jgi:hypothetical protein